MAVRTKHQINDSIWFITFTCYNWLPLFDLTSSYDLVYNWLNLIKGKYGIYTCGFVIMLNHVHVLLCLSNQEINLNAVISNGKRFMAYKLVKRLQAVNPSLLSQLADACTGKEKAKGQLHKVFEPSFDAKPVYNDAFLHQKLDYIHHNPLSGKWNLCVEYTDYLHSSAAFYKDALSHNKIEITNYRELDGFSA